MADKVEMVDMKVIKGHALQGIEGPCLMWMEVDPQMRMAIHMPAVIMREPEIMKDVIAALRDFIKQAESEAGVRH